MGVRLVMVSSSLRGMRGLGADVHLGVYLAKEAQTSMGHYAAGGRACWRKSKLGPTSCVALAEVVNLPSKFVSSNPHFVVKDTEWIMW
jgi:ubiquitin-conjugating enzyme E2 Q